MITLLQKFGYFPRLAVWELTLACNLNCRHCGSRAGKARDDELTTEEALQLCADLAALKCRYLTLGGGEPLARSDWPQLAEKLVGLGVNVNMVSNGRAWDHNTTLTAKRVGLESVAFSVDGLEETHEYIRRVKGHWRHIFDVIEDCKKEGLTASVITTVNRRNLHELEALRDILTERGVARWQIQLGIPSGNMADYPDLVISPEDVLDMVPLVAKLCRERKGPKVYPGHNVGYFGEPEEDLRDKGEAIPFWIGCNAGCSVIGIESNGNIKGCLSLPSAMNNVDAFVEGNIRQQPLAEIWNRPGAFSYNRDFSIEKMQGFCRTCDYAEICRGGCAWTAFSHTGSRLDNPYCYYRQMKLKEQRDSANAEK
jgi:radical SAM protein with 4Fe4S-binding SPASM domain